MKTFIKRDLPNDQYQAALNANAPTSANPFATIADVTGGGGLLHGIASGTNTYTTTITGVTAYTDGDVYVIRFTNASDADSTININGLGVKTLVKQTNEQLTGGDILAGQELLLIYDGTNFQCIGVTPNQMFAYVTNDDSVTITKGQPVYAFGAAGNRMSVKLAANTADATSAQTVGVVFSTSIAANQRGLVITQGVIDGLNTSMYNPGDQLYLGATAGALTNVKPYAPNHLVYIGIVERANAGNGQIYVKPQNGYELDELHDVDLISIPPADGDVLTYNSLTDLWEPAAIPGIVSGGTQLISGSASWSNTGLTFNTSTLVYTIDGTKYSTTPQNVTLAASDPSNPRFDAIVVNAAGVVSVITGTPATNPLVPSIPGTQVLVQYVLVGAGATTPSITNEFVYTDGSTPNWLPGFINGVTGSATSATPTPFQGTECTLISAPTYSTANFLKYTRGSGSISTNTYGFLSFRVQLLAGSSGRDLVVRLYNGTTYINALYASSWGLSKTTIGTWQLVVIPLAAFIGNSAITDITEVRFLPFGTVTGTTQFAFDDVKFQSGYGPQSNVAKIDILDTGVTVGSTAKLNFINGQYSVAVATNDIPNNKVDVKFDVTGIPLTTVLAAGNTTFGQSITLSNTNDFINVFTAGSFIGGTGLSNSASGIKFGGDGVGITIQQYDGAIGPTWGGVSLNINNNSLTIKESLAGGAPFPGAQYFADYSANYTARSLTDKGYVDSVAIPFIPLPDAYEVFRGRTFRFDSTTADTYAGIATLNNASALAVLPSTTNFSSKFTRLRYYASIVSTGRVTSIRSTDLQWFVGGGFRFVSTWRVADTAYGSTCQNFHGLIGTTAEIAVGTVSLIQVSTLTNCIFVGSDGADTNLQVMHNDASGTCTKIDLGAGFPANRTAGSEMTTMYNIQIYNEVNTTSVKYEVINLETGAVAQGTISTNLPATTQGLAIQSARVMGTPTTNTGQWEQHKWGCSDTIK